MPIYYLDGTTLANSTAIYTNAALTQCANAGYYSDGVITRKLVLNENGSCYLQAAEQCTSCLEPCGGTVNASGGQGIYKMNLSVGGTPSDVGAIIIQMNPYQIADGVFVQYNGTVYNKGVRAAGNTDTGVLGNGYYNAGGLAQSRNSTNYTVVGSNRTTCGVDAGLIGAGELDVFNYVNGVFVNSGTQETYNISLDDIVLQDMNVRGGDIENFVMVVPKTSATPEEILLQFIGPCGGTAFQIDVTCPTTLPGFPATIVQLSSANACASTLTDTLYAVGTGAVFGDAAPTTTPQIRDQVFNTSNASIPVTDGWYGYDDGANRIAIQTESGIVVDLVNCPA